MTEEEIRRSLWGEKEVKEHPAWPFFVMEMSNKQYGEVNDAWYYYRSGWEAHIR